jgi:hypothetical protein
MKVREDLCSVMDIWVEAAISTTPRDHTDMKLKQAHTTSKSGTRHMTRVREKLILAFKFMPLRAELNSLGSESSITRFLNSNLFK